MSRTATSRIARGCAFAAVLTTAAAVVTLVTDAAPGRGSLVAVLVVALVWGLGGVVAVALTPTRRARSRHDDVGEAPTTRLGVIMDLGGVPTEVARTTSAVAAAAGPVALVVPADRAVPELLDPSVIVVRRTDAGLADAVAALADDCDAVLFLSARALPAEGCHEAARRLAKGASWVVGAVEPLNPDRFGPTRRELLDGRLRRRAAAAGLWGWEPDATVVRTSLLRTHPLVPGRPMGSWLRQRAATGLVGATVDRPLARRAAPVAAEGYWPDTTARQRANAADLSDAAVSSGAPARARAVAAGLLLRALSGWSVVWWLTALVLLAGGSPVQRGQGQLAALVAVAVVLRWMAPHLAAGTRPAPLRDVVAGLYALPGSLAATTSAVARRVRPARRPVSTRPLVWLALVATMAAASVVLTAPAGDGASRTAAAIAVALLVLLWVFTVRSLVERSWRRVGFRIPLDLRATVDTDDGGPQHDEWTVVDGSPGGFGLRGPATGLGTGDEVTVRVRRPGGAELVLDGTVAGRRHGGRGAEMLGVELRSVVPGTAAWAEVLLEGASRPTDAATPVVDEQAESGAWGRLADRLAMGLVIGASLAVVVTLALVLAGLRPLVIRSGSMEPTYAVGDVVLVATERAGEIEPGQVVTRFDAPEAMDSLTHRVRSVSIDGGTVEVTTRGDANATSEVWSVPVDHQVGVVVASVPFVGLPLTAVRTSTGWAVVAGVAVLGVVLVLFRPRGRRRDEPLKPADELPTGTTKSISGDRT